jgi:hypothetical protein
LAAIHPGTEFPMIAPNTPVLEDVRSEFTEFLPALSERLSRRFRHRRPEARAEAVAEGVAIAWPVFMSARQRGREVTAGTLAHFAGAMVEAGRRLAGAGQSHLNTPCKYLQ